MKRSSDALKRVLNELAILNQPKQTMGINLYTIEQLKEVKSFASQVYLLADLSIAESISTSADLPKIDVENIIKSSVILDNSYINEVENELKKEEVVVNNVNVNTDSLNKEQIGSDFQPNFKVVDTVNETIENVPEVNIETINETHLETILEKPVEIIVDSPIQIDLFEPIEPISIPKIKIEYTKDKIENPHSNFNSEIVENEVLNPPVISTQTIKEEVETLKVEDKKEEILEKEVKETHIIESPTISISNSGIIKDLNSTINISRRFEYINKLFQGDSDSYHLFSRTVSSLNKVKAMEYYENAYEEFNWGRHKESADELKFIITKLFAEG